MKKLIYILSAFLLATVLFSCKGKDKTGPAYLLKMRLANGDKFGHDMDMDMEIKNEDDGHRYEHEDDNGHGHGYGGTWRYSRVKEN